LEAAEAAAAHERAVPDDILAPWWTLRIDGARIILPNLRASNGYIHVVDRVLNPLS
jgi:hypothetical protein